MAKQTSTSLVLKVAPATKKKGKKRGKGRSRRQRNNVPRLLHNYGASFEAYINTLNDPFTHPGVRLGFGTMIPTALATAYYKGSFTTNTDGTFSIFLFPYIGSNSGTGPIYQNTSGGGGSTYTLVNWNNYNQIQSLSNEGRVISGGIRLMHLVPMTSAPGILHSGYIPSASINNVTSINTNSAVNYPTAKTGLSYCGSIATIRPVDPSSFIFTANVISPSASVLSTSTVPFIAGSGVGATTIYFEAVLNIEYILGTGNSSVFSTTTFQEDDTNTLLQNFPSVEAVYNAAKRFIKPENIMHAALEYAENGDLSQAASTAAGFKAMNSHGAGIRSGHSDRVNSDFFRIELLD